MKSVLLGLWSCHAAGEFVKGTFHQHAMQKYQSCHRAADDIDACGYDCMHEQDDGGTDVDTLLTAFTNSKRGYGFVGIVGNEEPPVLPTKTHPIVTIPVTESQIGKMCTEGDKHCKSPCDPVPPSGSGPWTTIDINNLHREYIQGVKGYFVQHPTTDPQRLQILGHMQSGVDNLRGMEIYNHWVEQSWDHVVPLDDAKIDPYYPEYVSGDCTAWSSYDDQKGSCNFTSPIFYWDETLRSLKRPIWGLADDDGFVYTGDSDKPVYPHKKGDVSTNTPSWFRFGAAYTMADLPTDFTAADVSSAVDNGQFYASTGVELNYTTTGDVITVTAEEPVVFAVLGGTKDAEADAIAPLKPLTLKLCANSDGVVSNVGCASSSGAPPLATELQVDLREINASFFYVRVQAMVRTRYLIKTAPTKSDKHWSFELATTPNPVDVTEGRLLRATGASRRPFLIHSVSGNTIKMVKKFHAGYGDITPDQTTVSGIVSGEDELVAERWAWMQPIFRETAAGRLVDPFLKQSVV